MDKQVDITMKIAKEFSTTLGLRYRKDGDFSGEEFRDDFLIPWFEKNKEAQHITIDLNGAIGGYSFSFLEESFGGSVRRGYKTMLEKVTFIYDRAYKIEEIKEYIGNAHAVQ